MKRPPRSWPPTAQSTPADQPLGDIMTRQVIAAAADDTILALVSKLGHHDLSALPVVHGEAVLGMVTTDLLAQRSLLRLLLTRPNTGSYGANPDHGESDRAWPAGLAVRAASPMVRNWRAEGSLDDDLHERGTDRGSARAAHPPGLPD